MTSRPATIADVPLLAEFNHQLIRDERHHNPMTVPQLAVRMQGWLESKEYRAEIFEDGREVIAYAIFREDPSELHLRQFFVVRDRRRKRHGKAAMQLLFNAVWPANKRITVEVLADNAAALGFYRALGFNDYAVTLEMPAKGVV
ncbi:MAG: GNAT family N-acetyltransferase [Opitutaceae bacterium]